jgi:pilus assembly protein Flp/PilA
MADFIRRLRVLRLDRRAVTALEYGIIASTLAVVLIAAFAKLGTPISEALYGVGSSI